MLLEMSTTQYFFQDPGSLYLAVGEFYLAPGHPLRNFLGFDENGFENVINATNSSNYLFIVEVWCCSLIDVLHYR